MTEGWDGRALARVVAAAVVIVCLCTWGDTELITEHLLRVEGTPTTFYNGTFYDLCSSPFHCVMSGGVRR